MANATKYFAEFTDLFGQQWRINIHDSEFAGTEPTEFTLGASGFSLSYKGDTENVFQPVIGSSVQFEFIEQTAAHTAFINALATAAESRFSVTIHKLVGGSYQLEWFGVLLSDQWTMMNEPLPRSSMLTASDDLGNLKRIAYKSDPATAYTGHATLIEHLVNALAKTRALHPFETNDDFVRVADDFKATNMSVTNRFMENIRTHHESFWAIDDDGNREFMTAFDVVRNVCKSQNARLFLAGGVFYFVPIGAYQNNTAIAFHNYDINGDFVGTSTATETLLATGTDLVQMAGNEKRFTPPLSEAKRTREYNGNAPVVWSPYIAQNAFTTAITDFGVDYFAGQLINFVGVVNVTLPGVDPAFGISDADERVGRIGIGVQFKCGSQYATAAITFGGQGNFGFDDGSVGTYDLANYGPLDWSGTSGTTTFLSEPFDRNNGTNQNIGLTFTTGALPSTQSGLEITLSIYLVTNDGTFVAIDDGLNVADAPAYFAQNVRAYRADVDGGGSEITFSAIGDEVNRAIKIDDVVTLGDRISDSERGVLSIWDGSDWTDAAGWNSSNYTGTGVGINRLAVNEILRTMRNPIPIWAGQIHVAAPNTIGALVTMLNTIEIDSDVFLFTEFTMNTNARILDFEAARIQRDTTNITEATTGKKNVSDEVTPGGFNPGNDSNGLSNAVGTAGTAIANLESTTAAIQTKTDFITITQSVNLDSVESTTNSNAASVVSLTNKLSYLLGTFQPKDDPGNTITKVVYADGKTDGLEMSLTQTTAAFTSNSGNTAVSISEQSPGKFVVDLQDESTGSSTAIFATGDSRGNRVGVNTSSPSFELDVVGRLGVSGMATFADVVEALNVAIAERLSFATNAELTPANGEMVFDSDRTAFVLGIGTAAVDMENDWWICRNNTGTSIAAGVPVYVNGTLGASGRKTIAPMIADGTIDARYFIGVTAEAIANGADGVVFDRGTIRGVSLSGFTDGDVLFVSQTTAGTWTTTEPASGMVLAAAFVIHAASNGVMAVRNNGESSGGGGGTSGNAFETIAVSGQSSIVADSSTDTLTIAAGTNAVVTTNAATDTLTIAVSSTPTFASILSTGAISAIGTISTLGSFSAQGSATFTSDLTCGGTFTSNGAIIGSGGLTFTSGGTSIIGPNNSLPNQPADLEIRSNGNVVVVLDYDDNETGQSFEIKNGDGTTIFKVDETGITSGLLTTAAPVVSGLSGSYQQGANATATISNHVNGRTYVGAIYDSSGTEITANPVSIDSSGNVSFVVPTSIATDYEMRIVGVDAGKFQSLETIETFDVTPSRTFTHWRFQVKHDGGEPGSRYVMAYNIDMFEGSNATGTKHPSAALTSATSLAGLVVTWGYSYPGREFWKCFDANETGTDWWTISSPTGTDWGQLEFDTAITIASVQLTFRDQFSNANELVVLGSNTGDFSGEEIECGKFDLPDGTNDTITITINI